MGIDFQGVLNRDAVLQEFFSNISVRSDKTATQYARGVAYLLKHLGIPSSQDLLEKIKGGNLDPYQVIREWVTHLSEVERVTPMTIRSYVNGVKRFLAYGDVELNRDKFRAKVVLPISEALTEDRIPTKDELRLLFNLTNLRGKTILLTLIHGIRVGEANQLKVADIKLSEEIPHIALKRRITKGHKGERLIPLTPEAVSYFKQYIQVNHLKPEDNFLGIGSKGIRRFYTRLLERANLAERDESTKIRVLKLHLHTLRKFAKTMLASAGCQDSFVAAILGHRKYLDESYFRANLEMIKKEFEKAVPNLTIGEHIRQSNEVDRTLEALKAMGISEQELFERLKTRFHFQVGPAENMQQGQGHRNSNMSIYEVVSTVFPQEWKQILRETIRRKKRRMTHFAQKRGAVKEQET